MTFLDVLAICETDIIELDQDRPVVFALLHRIEGYGTQTHMVIPTRLGGTYSRQQGSFSVKFIEGLCKSCNDLELFATADIEEAIDPVTGEVFDSAGVAARLHIKQVILSPRS